MAEFAGMTGSWRLDAAMPPESPGRTPVPPLINRELSLLSFNRRVLALAQDPAVPLLERLRFLCIVSSNLDEFFEIRLSGVKEQIKLGTAAAGPDGLPPAEVFKQVSRAAHDIVHRKYKLLNEEIFPALAKEGIRFLRRSEWNP